MLNKKWDVVLASEFSKPYFKKLVSDIRDEYKMHTVYPNADDVFNAFIISLEASPAPIINRFFLSASASFFSIGVVNMNLINTL